MPFGIRLAQFSIALPKMRKFKPRALRCAAIDKPNGPAPTMATSHSSESRIRQLSLAYERVWAVPVDGQIQLECVQERRILSRYVEIEVVAVTGSRGPSPIMREQGHSLLSARLRQRGM